MPERLNPDLPEKTIRTEGSLMSYIETPPDHRFPWYVRLFLANQRRR